jgi:hypothetical protein
VVLPADFADGMGFHLNGIGAGVFEGGLFFFGGG